MQQMLHVETPSVRKAANQALPDRMMLKIGTRGSKLALAQARETAARLAACELGGAIETVIIKTSGDAITDRALSDAGGKGLFAKEIEEALIDRRVDLAVHSLKDLPAVMPPGLCLAGVLPREDARDALIGVPSLAALPVNGRLGTSSPRRKAQMLSVRPDLEIVLFRGNVDTRLAKLRAGEVQATLLAMAGLNRLGLSVNAVPLAVKEFIPAACQGAIGLQCRKDDQRTRDLAAQLNHAPSSLTIAAERGFLAGIGGSCKTPLAAHAMLTDGGLMLRAALFAPDGSAMVRGERFIGPTPDESQTRAMGEALAQDLLMQAPPAFLAVR
ncbi:MAG TPA: hydroxymethylbilane synthase [Micropepsaceae bacterium]|nr:hydroxymethylbilane synthase [Micropepsaceae bacterium]